MRVLVIAAGIAVGLTTSAVADPSFFLAPDDPAIGSGWRPPVAATHGLESVAPVEAKDWLELNGAADGRPPGSRSGTDKGMPGMEHGR